MICSQCGTLVDKSYKFCPKCGNNLPSHEQDPPSSEMSNTSQTLQKRKMPLWFKLLSIITVIALIGVTAGILFTESLVDVIDNQLKALRHSDVESAYHYTSKEFQKVTSLDEFQNFIETHPIFINNISAHFTQRSIEHNIGTIKGNLTSSDHIKIPIEYKLIKEQGKWKILSIKFLNPEIRGNLDSKTIQNLNNLIQNQLENLKQEKVTDAYLSLSSKEFKEATNLESFQNFVKKYPILTQYDNFNFNRSSIQKGIGMVSVDLSMKDTVAHLKYYLIKEDGEWKIWSMRILSNKEEENVSHSNNAIQVPTSTESKQMIFTEVLLGTKLDGSGNIQSPSTIFRADSGDIYVNVDVKHGVVDEIVYLNFQHLDSHSSILAKVLIEEPGDSTIVSVFSPPIGGWPKGKYQLIASSSIFSKTINFIIE